MDGNDQKKKIVLVVDDDSTNLMAAQRILSKKYKVAAAKSGAMVLRYLEKNRPDMILLDINMPEMDGFETLAKVRENEDFVSIPVVFLTADEEAGIRDKCLQAGGADFVKKPFVPDDLFACVSRILGEEGEES